MALGPRPRPRDWRRSVDQLAWWLSGRVLRPAERWLPVFLLRVLLWPVAALMAARELITLGLTSRVYSQLPPSLRPTIPRWRRFWRLWGQRTDLCLTRFLRIWPDRLREPRWHDRCLFLGFERVESALATGRAVILVTLHYGPINELYHVLRARGLRVAALADRDPRSFSAFRNQVNFLADQANGLDGVPHFFEPDQLWDARDFLRQPRSLLLAAIEGHTKRDVFVQGPDYRLRLAPGALRLAAITDAVVIPCIIRVPQGAAAAIDFGTPVPEGLIVDQRRHAAACEHLAAEFVPWIATAPELCSLELLCAIHDPEAVPEASA